MFCSFYGRRTSFFNRPLFRGQATPTESPFAVCTIIAPNYLPRALVLHDSLKAHHPEADFWLLLVDETVLPLAAEEALHRRGIHLLRVQDIGLPPEEIANFRFAYDLTEVSTAYKPWTMETVARRSGHHVFYLDPDIQFFAPIQSLVAAVEGHELVLTPHVLQPMKRDGRQPTEATIKGSGIYNLGFLGMNRAASRVIPWWKERLKRECYSSPADQLFTDQRWMDFAPGLFDCHISKDETFNVAYWNADQRPIRCQHGRYLVGEQPLAFFHFSGLDEAKPHLLTRHHAGQPRVLLSEYPVLGQLTRDYLQAIDTTSQEWGELESEYGYDHFPGGGNVDSIMRRLFLHELTEAEKKGREPIPSPFGPGGEEPFFAWLQEPECTPAGPFRISRLVLRLRALRPDLVGAFPDPCGRDAARLIEWFRAGGHSQFCLPSALIPAPLILADEPSTKRLRPGLEIIGYLQTESGVGQAARLLARAVESSSIPFYTLVDSSAPSRQQHPFRRAEKHPLATNEAYECCVLCVNADSVAALRRRLGHDFLEGRRVAGLWFWEVETLPESLHAAFKEVDEVWVASDFIRRILAPISPVPVHWIPLPFGAAEPAGPLDRAALGLPEGFFFLFSFDFHSVFRRKNPIAIVEAFQAAFPEGEGPTLVIKGINGDCHTEALEQLRYAARDRRDIFILSEYLDAATNQALTAACGCYISLHRSEGLGLTMAEAMSRGKPVIATSYSGNMDFMNERNSYLCRYEMEPVGHDSLPYCSNGIWAKPDVSHAAELMRLVYTQPEEAAGKGGLAAAELGERFSPERCAVAIEARWQALHLVEAEERKVSPASPQTKVTISLPVASLRALWKRPYNPAADVPSWGTMLFQGPAKVLRKLMGRMARHRKPFDKALVETAIAHDKRLATLERALAEIHACCSVPPRESLTLHNNGPHGGNGHPNGAKRADRS